uniref:C2H2-type domain-containing protein n=1 Tax=Parascaris univalens TaxID=6257 RepID=A0A915C8X6_PARUN
METDSLSVQFPRSVSQYPTPTSFDGRSMMPRNAVLQQSANSITNSFLTDDSFYYTPNEVLMDTEMQGTTANATHSSDISSLASNLRTESFALGEASTFSTIDGSVLPSQNSNWSMLSDTTMPPTYHNLEPLQRPTNNQSNIPNDTSGNVLRIVRMCPECHKSVEDLLSHYEHSHGTWNEEDKRAYLARERQRIEKSEISEGMLRSRLHKVGCNDEKVIYTIKELLLECGIKTLNLQKQEKFSPEHPFILVWKNWLIQKKRFNLNDNEEFDTVCKMLTYIFDEDVPSWRLLVKRKNRIAHFVRSRQITDRSADMATTAVKSLQTFRSFVIISFGSKANGDEDIIDDDQYRDFLNFLDEESYKFRRVLNKQRMEKPVVMQAMKRAKLIHGANRNPVRTALSEQQHDEDIAEEQYEKVSEADWRSGYHFTEKWKKFALSKLDFEVDRKWNCDDIRCLDELIPDEVLTRGDHQELKRVRQTVYQVCKGLWQRFQISQVLLDYKGDFKDAKAAREFYLSEVARKRWPVANLTRSFNGVLNQFRNGYRPKRKACASTSAFKGPANRTVDTTADDMDDEDTTLQSPEKRGAWDLSSSSDDDLFSEISNDRSPPTQREQSVGAQTVMTHANLIRAKTSRTQMTPRTAALKRDSTTSSSSTSNDSDYLRFSTVCERYETMETLNEDDEDHPRCSTMREDCMGTIFDDLDVSSIAPEYSRTSTPICGKKI